MTILTDLKAFLTANSFTNIKYNYGDGSDSCIILWEYGGEPDKFVNRKNIQITVKNTSMSTVESTINTIYNLLYPKNTNVENFITLNSTLYKLEALQPPFYLEKDDQNRHSYVFNISVTAKR